MIGRYRYNSATRALCGGLVAAALLSGAPAQAQESLQDRLLAPASTEGLVDARAPERLREILGRYGTAQLRRDVTGDPLIVGTIDGVNFGLFFHGCVEGQNCLSVQFAAAFSGAPGTPSDFATWNARNRFAKAILGATGAPQLVMDVNLTFGVTEQTFDSSVNWWRSAATSFRDFLRSL